MIAARAAALLFAAALACAAPCGAATASSASDPHAVAASVARELKVQQGLPSEEGSREHPLTGTEGGRSGASAPASSFRPADLTTVVLWLAGIFAALFVGSLLADVLRGGRRRERRQLTTAGDDAAGSQHAAARASLSTADELAAAGRYTEAIHQLLADAVALLRRRAGAELSDALTSREIVRALRLPQPERGALGEIVARVEQTWFAQRAAAAEDYDAVRASFRVFTLAGAAAG